MRAPIVFAMQLACWLAASVTMGQDPSMSTVGMPARIDQFVWPGSELEPVPLADARRPIVLRITGVFRHGTDYRYDLVYYGLEPGAYNLAEYVRRKDGSPSSDLPPVMVEIKPVLPPGQVEPHAVQARRLPFLGGYQALLLIGSTVWLAGLVALLFARRRRPRTATNEVEMGATLAGRLRPLVDDAVAGRLSSSRQAELDRLLLGFWRRRLGLEGQPAAQAITMLRNHEEAGQLLRQLEAWLHSPRPDANVDVASLLEPYRQLEYRDT